MHEPRTCWYIKVHGWDGEPTTHEDPVWQTILEALAHRHCYYTIKSNTSIAEIEASAYRGILEGARIREVYEWTYPASSEKSLQEITIFGKVGNMHECGFKQLRFNETYGAETLQIAEPQYPPMIEIFQDLEVAVVELHLTTAQRDILVKALKDQSCELQHFTPQELDTYGIASEQELRID
jgi:hypothetical protein